MASNRPEVLHAWLLVHCSPKDAINCITLQLGPDAVTQIVKNLCGRHTYYKVMEMTKRDMERGRVEELAGIFDPQPPIASFHSSIISSDRSAPRSSATWEIFDGECKTISSGDFQIRNEHRRSESAPGFVLSPTGAPDQFCSIGKSDSPYRFVRGDFLRRFGPMHPTAACEELKTYVDLVGYVSSSECVYLTWHNYGSNATHSETFWILETEGEGACDLLIANRPISGHPDSFYDAEDNRSSLRTQQASFTNPHREANSTRHDEEQLEVPLKYFLGRAKLDGSLSLSDHDGSTFLHELSELYAVAYKNNPVLDRCSLQLQLTPIIEGMPTDDRVVYLLKQAGFQRRWNKILEFAREQQSYEGFEEIRVQLLQPGSAGQS